jgi:hypothetical protein
LTAACKSLASVGNGLHGGVDRNPLEITASQCAGPVCHAQALGQEKFQLVAEPLASVAQVRTLMGKLMLEKLLPGKVLKLWIIDPALAHASSDNP